jgi:hypothetical protein
LNPEELQNHKANLREKRATVRMSQSQPIALYADNWQVIAMSRPNPHRTCAMDVGGTARIDSVAPIGAGISAFETELNDKVELYWILSRLAGVKKKPAEAGLDHAIN